jgi:hypothetical protein
MDNYREPLITKKQPRLTETVVPPPQPPSPPPPLPKPKKIKNEYKQRLLFQEQTKAKNSLILNLVILFVFVGFMIFFIMNCKEDSLFSNTEPEPYERLLLV